MKALIVVLFMGFSALCFGASSPYPTWIEDYRKDTRYNTKQIERGIYDYDVVGGAVGSYNLPVKIPANSVITHVYFENTTSFVDGGSGTASIGCEGVADLFASADITGNSTGDFTEGIQDDTVANYTTIESGCTPKLHIDGAAATEGKLTVYFEYITIK
jgi:hypothetical protein